MASSLLWRRAVRLSRYSVVYRDAFPGEHVLYDVVTDRYAGVDDALHAAIARGRDAAPRDEGEREAFRALEELGVLVQDDAADDARFAAAERRAAEGMPGTVYATLMPTLACNLACTYCFQKDHPASGRMSRDTEAAAVSWILARVGAAGATRLRVHFIGGEPLTQKALVLRTARAFATGMAERGGTFEWELTTNGTGLEVTFVRDLRATGKGALKVTLDGDRETHDAARVRRDGRGTFDEVFASTAAVARACPDVAVRIGGNFRGDQVESYERLLDRLELAGLAGKLDGIRFKPVLDTAGGGCSGCGGAAAEDDAFVQLGRSISRRNLARTAVQGADSLTPCELHWENSWVIDPRGRVYKCLMVAGRPEMAVGDVREVPARADPLTAGKPWLTASDCAACPFQPVCLGGCLGGRFLMTGRTGETLCRRPMFEKTFREEVVRRYLAEFHPAVEKQAAEQQAA